MGAPRVGILAIQGDVDAHRRTLDRLGVASVRVRGVKDLDAVAALILPGGESTTLSKGLARVGLYEPIRAFAQAGRPILGTCARCAARSARSARCGPKRSRRAPKN